MNVNFKVNIVFIKFVLTYVNESRHNYFSGLMVHQLKKFILGNSSFGLGLLIGLLFGYFLAFLMVGYYLG